MSDADGNATRKRPAPDFSPNAARKRPRLNAPTGFPTLAFDTPAPKITRKVAPSNATTRNATMPTPTFNVPAPGPSSSKFAAKQPTTLKPGPASLTPKPKAPTKLLQPPKLSTAPATPVKHLRHTPLPPPPPVPTTPAKPKRLLQPPRVPVPLPEPVKRPLRALSTPVPVPGPATLDDGRLKPLSSTRFALASTPDNGQEGVSFAQSIFASVHDPAMDDPERQALARGFAPSPEKAAKGKRSYVKSALADFVEQYIDRASKALVLWQEDARRQDPRRLDPAMTVTVRSVRARAEHSGGPTVPRSVLSTCSVRGEDSERTILFTASGEPFRGSAPMDVKEGSRVMIWHPWTILDSEAGPVSADNAGDGESAPKAVLLCSRFVVAR
ncbi:hypothetical protein EXIGLDRAFT_828715 [Exidia glandulosa HHB12029]|uniref:Uncharacterized protein n=1 Tax=Exidia glandulosa HHB12029 TaxID=1314781 RepID=A0A165QBE5_EXIGL|nr:hypothetical protein EXIGLDRAFT_828715 [Exidia glandulosa HHB12029]